MARPIKRITVLCRMGCGRTVSTCPSHFRDAICPTCKSKNHAARTNEARRIRLGIKPREKRVVAMTEDEVRSYAYWGN